MFNLNSNCVIIFTIINCLAFATAYHFHVEDNYVIEFETIRIKVTTTTTKSAEVPCHRYWTIEKLPASENEIAARENTLKGAFLKRVEECIDKSKDEYICHRAFTFNSCFRDARRKTMLQLYEATENCAIQHNMTKVNNHLELLNMYNAMKWNYVPAHACYLTCVLQQVGILNEKQELRQDSSSQDFFKRFDIDLVAKNEVCKNSVPSYVSTEDCGSNYWVMQCAYRKAFTELAVELRMLYQYEILEKIYD